MPEQITVYGSLACEDTAITRSRFEALGVRYDWIDIDADAGARATIERLNAGSVRTPTVVRGDGAEVVAEPTVERAEELARNAGYVVMPPEAAQLHGAITGRPIALRTRPAAGGADFSLTDWRGRRQVALFLGHAPDCLACFGYARQLAAQSAAMAQADAAPLIVTAGGPERAAEWLHGLPDDTILLADAGAEWHAEIARDLGVDAKRPALVLLDRYLAPRAYSVADEAGALISPSEATAWLDFVALECSECAGEVSWPA